jgi:UDP-N-acetylglucosamine 2-epimerase
LPFRVLSILGGRPHPPKASSIHDAFWEADAEHVVIAVCPPSDLSRMLRDIDYVQLPKPISTVRFSELTILSRDIQVALQQARPDVVILYGDLWPSVTGLLVACSMGLPTVHIEAGYRSGDLLDPQEALRILLDHSSSHRIAFDGAMADTLVREGIARESISIFPNPNLVALNKHLPVVSSGSPNSNALVHLHHDENLLDYRRLRYLLDQLLLTAEVLQLRLRFLISPYVERRLREHGLLAKVIEHPNIEIIPDQGYREYLKAIVSASLVFTDSSSLQDECMELAMPCVVLRRATPRPPSAHKYVVTEIDGCTWDLPTITSELTRRSGLGLRDGMRAAHGATYARDLLPLLRNVCERS